MCRPFYVCECQIKFIRYSISQRVRILYAYSSVCHNSARSAFFSIQSARRFPLRARFYPDGSAENRGDLRSVKRKQEAARYCRQKSSPLAGSIKRIKAANREAKGRHRPGFSSFLSSCARLVHSPLASYPRGEAIEKPTFVKSRAIVF